MNLNTLIEEHKLIICCGSGGVGKTTLSAALGVKACLMGKKVAVLTIDPAKRLANSLGLSKLNNDEREISTKQFAKFNLTPSGKLYALMLDSKRTFDKIIERYAPNESSKQSIFENPLYQQLSNMIAGSQEYMAMERVYDLYQQKKYDLLILDTPPTRHALDFLEAPQKMTQLVGDSLLKWFLKPSLFVGRSSLKFLERGAKRIFGTFDKVIGFEFMQDLSMMLISAAGLLEGFGERAKEVQALLHHPETAFLLVTSPQPAVISEAIFFYEKLKEFELPFAGFILNRVYPDLFTKTSRQSLARKIAQWKLTQEEKEKMELLLKTYSILIDRDQSEIARLKDHISPKTPLTLIPRLENDVHDLGGLAELGEYL